jgi:3-methyladenine DNA glycosylase AlkD
MEMIELANPRLEKVLKKVIIMVLMFTNPKAAGSIRRAIIATWTNWKTVDVTVDTVTHFPLFIALSLVFIC